MRFTLSSLLVVAVNLTIFASITHAQEAIALSTKKAPEHEITLTTVDEFTLTADYLVGKKHQDGFLFLHDCHSDRSEFATIAQQLNEQGYHALLLDLRGFGRSVSDEFSHHTMKRHTNDIIDYQAKLGQLSSYWQQDVILAYEFLRKHLDASNHISLIASSCSVPFAITTAESFYVANLVLLTPELDRTYTERYKNLNDIATYFISSYHHTPSFETTKELFIWNGHSRSKLQLFKGNNTGLSLLKGNRTLTSDIAMWLKDQTK
ncbi:serine aminopeptidase domain-containing protein [Colwellia sp. MEBiC06753]